MEVRNLVVHYGGVEALKGVSLDVNEREAVAVVGANGAGKSTMLNAISGFAPIIRGEICFKGESIVEKGVGRIFRKGIVQIAEGRATLSTLSVLENLELGAYHRKDKGQIKKDIEKFFEIFSILGERRYFQAGNLSGGEQQMLAFARALMAQPKLLMMDEPSMGLAPLVVKEIFRIIKSLNSEGTTILLVEQNARMALKTVERVFVLENGQIAFHGKSSELLNSKKVVSAYLGST